ncbi:MAG: hypothetical protein WA082_00435 [Candidatus Moraniibacteriota bacterium]
MLYNDGQISHIFKAMARVEKTEILSETPKKNRALSAIVVLVILLFLSVGIAGYFYYQLKNVGVAKSETDEITELIQTIGATLELPEGEAPTLATVTDKEKLAEQPFFQKAENGDKVLIYANTGRAILYRPSTKKIVDVTTVNVNTPTQAEQNTTPAPETTQQPQAQITAQAVPSVARVALLNGSTTVGVTNAKEKQLTALYADITVVSKEAAVKNDYEQTIVVDVTGKNAELAGKIATTLGGVVATLPAAETAPVDTDILVIVGNNK